MTSFEQGWRDFTASGDPRVYLAFKFAQERYDESSGLNENHKTARNSS